MGLWLGLVRVGGLNNHLKVNSTLKLNSEKEWKGGKEEERRF